MTESTRNPQLLLPILGSLRCNSHSGSVGLLVRRSNTQHVRTAICVPFSASHLCLKERRSPETAVLAEVWNHAFADARVSHPERMKASVHLPYTRLNFSKGSGLDLRRRWRIAAIFKSAALRPARPKVRTVASGDGTNISANVPLEEISRPFKLINAVCLGRTLLK